MSDKIYLELRSLLQSALKNSQQFTGFELPVTLLSFG